MTEPERTAAANRPAGLSGPTLTFVGTATTLLSLGPFTLLTDPNFLHRGQRAYLGKGLWSRRRTEPALQPHQLPDLDGIVLSHLHGDHWDRIARRSLDRDLPLFTTEPAARTLSRRQGFRRAVGMATWRTEQLHRADVTLRITALPGWHARGAVRALLPPVMGTMLELVEPDRPPFRVYLTGDTLCVPELREVAERWPTIDAAVVHLGGTRVLGALVTMDAREGCELIELVRPLRPVPVHYDDYAAFKSPLEDFAAMAARRPWGERVAYVNRGDTVRLGR